MKIWYDACTGKHMRYGNAIAKRLRQSGHNVTLTTREHPDTIALAQILGEKPIIVGKYAPTSRVLKLQESTNRMLQFLKLLKNNLPDVAVSHHSVELCRTAFGLGVPIVLTADTPHATAVNRLTLPLANIVIASEAIPKHVFRKYGAQKLVQFRGVDEIAWIKDFKPPRSSEFRKPLIVIRQMETGASYALDKNDQTVRLAKKLSSMGNVLFIPRYPRTEKQKLKVTKEFADTASIVANADLVVSVGGTISREAALQGIPSIVISELGHTYVNRYLADLGFPLFMTNPAEAMKYAEKYLGKKFEVKPILAELENPLDLVEKTIIEIQHSKER